jgi:hypothetical protein
LLGAKENKTKQNKTKQNKTKKIHFLSPVETAALCRRPVCSDTQKLFVKKKKINEQGGREWKRTQHTKTPPPLVRSLDRALLVDTLLLSAHQTTHVVAHAFFLFPSLKTKQNKTKILCDGILYPITL